VSADGPSNAGRRGGTPARLGELLSPALERLGPQGLWKESKLRKVWPAIVGADVAANAYIARLRGRVLEVHVTSDAWATELTYLAPSIVEKLNDRVHESLVDEVVVRRRRNR
jgi:predicted nucleic acid-binding Zn ribbon protein